MLVGNPMFEDSGNYGKYKSQEKVMSNIETDIKCKSCDEYKLVWKFSDGPKDKPIMKLYHCLSCGNYTQISLEKGIVINDQTFFQMARHMGKTKMITDAQVRHELMRETAMIPGDQEPPTADEVRQRLERETRREAEMGRVPTPWDDHAVDGHTAERGYGNNAFNTVHQEQVNRGMQAGQAQARQDIARRLNRTAPIGELLAPVLGAAGFAEAHRLAITPEQITNEEGNPADEWLPREEQQPTDEGIIYLANRLIKEQYKSITYLWIIGIILVVQVVNLIFTYLVKQ